MSDWRVLLLGLAIAVLGGGLGYQHFENQRQQRLTDYTTHMTTVHGEAMTIYKEARESPVLDQIFAGEEVDVEDITRAATLYRESAAKTRQAREKLARIIAPPEAEKLQSEGLAYLDTRAEMMDLGTELLEELEKQARGQGGSQSRAQDLAREMSQKSAEINRLSDSIRDTKDALVMQP